jgi:hypothetical protein
VKEQGACFDFFNRVIVTSNWKLQELPMMCAATASTTVSDASAVAAG